MMYVMFICHVLFLFSTCILAETGEDLNSLFTDIYTTRAYNKKIRPLKDQTKVLNVGADFFLNSIIDFDERTETLKTSGFLYLNWTDEYFQWTPASYNNTYYIFVPQDDIWKPDVSLKNSYKTFTGLGSSYLNVYITSDGEVNWTPFQVFESACASTITYFPFDLQICDLHFTAWSYSNEQVELTSGKDGIQMEEYIPNSSWEILETVAYEASETDAGVVYRIILKRKPRFYVMNIILPVILLSFLNASSFLLPATSGERAGYSISVFLSLTVFLTIISSLLPKNSENTSLLAVYIMLISGLSTMNVVLSLVQVRLLSWNDTLKPVCKFFRSFIILHDCIRCRTCKKSMTVANDETLSIPDLEDDKRDTQSKVTWLDVVNAMDFIFSVVSFVYTCICTFVLGILAVNVSE